MPAATNSDVTAVLTRKTENISIYTNPAHELHTVKGEIPKPGPGECLIHVRATGICGSDVHFWKAGRIGTMVVKGDNVLGHESAGVVVGLGEGVEDNKIGDRVAIECGIPCMKPTCYFCRVGRYNACPEVVFFSTPPYNGTLRRYHVHPAAWLHPLPDHLSYEEGSLLEPLSVALAGVDRANLRLGDPVVICGAGPIGLVSLLAAHAAGAVPIVITDIDSTRLEVAKGLVPRVKTVLVGMKESAQEVGARIKSTMGGEAALVLECTGVESSIHSGIYSCRFGGLVFVIGVGKDYQSIPFMHMSAMEIDLKFQYRYHDTYPKAIRLVADGLIDLKPLVTHRFTLESGEEAFAVASNPTSRSIKVQIIDE